MYIIGISAFYHDSAACILKNGEIIAASQEERFTRKKHDSSFPANAILYCLKEAKISPQKISKIVFYEKPFLKFERLLETYLAFAPKGFISFSKSMPLWIKNKLFQKSELVNNLRNTLGSDINWNKKLFFSEHHVSHAASAFFPSPFKKAAILTLDGVGEWTTTSLSIGDGRDINFLKEIHFPHSLGLLYSAFTHYLGFKVNSGEYKVMGLAPYGVPKYVKQIKNNLIRIAEDGSFQLNMNFFNYATGLTMTNKKFDNLFGAPPRSPESKITQRDMDLAASIQKVTEDIVIKLAESLANETGEVNLCLAGGVALNCVINGILSKKNIFKNIWIQPAAGDAGGAVGAALAVWHIYYQKERKVYSKKDSMKGSFLGPEFKDKEIEKELQACGAKFIKLSEDKMIKRVVDALVDKKSIGWMQGRMEFGPRSLGCRSIIADPRCPKMQKKLNLQIKYRESFRPFAPSILFDDLQNWFDLKFESPYMLFVADVIKKKRRSPPISQKQLFGLDLLNVNRSLVPAITHVNYSARIQTVHKETNSIFYKLISSFKEKTGCPILINTSFNVRGEPIICSPTDAFKCFMGTGLDVLAIGNYFLIKSEQDIQLKTDYKYNYELD
ncbi:carbamoyltransferase [Alphaproteobacteria bacterium]|nr:carbamoyltransferase [Alphaproteobacteria bacterium]